MHSCSLIVPNDMLWKPRTLADLLNDSQHWSVVQLQLEWTLNREQTFQSQHKQPWSYDPLVGIASMDSTDFVISYSSLL